MSQKKFYLLQVNDALFPIGAYSHSQGLETYIQNGIVHDEKTAEEYIKNKIKWNFATTELLSVKLAYESAEAERLEELDFRGIQNSDGTKRCSQKNGLSVCKDD